MLHVKCTATEVRMEWNLSFIDQLITLALLMGIKQQQQQQQQQPAVPVQNTTIEHELIVQAAVQQCCLLLPVHEQGTL